MFCPSPPLDLVGHHTPRMGGERGGFWMRLSGRDSGKNSLSPIDPEELLLGLQLTTGKAAEFCDISRRQLCYWTDKGIVETVEGNDESMSEEGARRVYDFSALKRVLLIKQLLEQGRGLKRATREVESYLQQQDDESLRADADRRTREDLLQRQTERLEVISEQVRNAIQRHRVNPAELRELAQEIHFFLELMAYEESATLHLQEDIDAANQFRSMIEQLTLHIEATAAEPVPGLRRAVR
ncbi:MAG: MerR family transcriptional regulator [Armatimonadota bacterium]